MMKSMLISIIMGIITKMIIMSIIKSIMNMMRLGIRRMIGMVIIIMKNMNIIIMIKSRIRLGIMKIMSSKNKIIRRKRLKRRRVMGISARLISPITISITIHILITFHFFTTINRNIISIKVIKFCFIGSSTLLTTSITKYLNDYIQTYFALL